LNAYKFTGKERDAACVCPVLYAPDGRRVENIMEVGPVRDFPKEKDAWREVDRLGLLVRINEAPCPGRIRFSSLCEQYLKNDFGADAVRPKTERTILNTEHIVRAYLIPRWGKEIADDIKSIDIQRWLKSLHDDDELAWTKISKMRGTMLRVYKVGILHELVSKNPVLPVEIRCSTARLTTRRFWSLRNRLWLSS
jgi:hypothetical protein